MIRPTESDDRTLTDTGADRPSEIPSQAPGTILLDDYQVVRHLGRGGMGSVYLVKSRSTGREYAVKRVLPELVSDPGHRRSFLAELLTWSELPEHPHLTPFRFFRSAGSELLIFAEYIPGGALSQWIRSGRLTEPAAILDAALQVAWGLEATHRCGVIHQDVKPGNVLMTPEGMARLTDFGLARAVPPEPGTQRSGPAGRQGIGDTPVTCRGGTPAYCSPEQADRLPLTHRTDLWSWGMTVLELFNGGVTWAAGWMGMDALEDLQRDGPIQPELPAMPGPVAEVLRRCFREDPVERWADLGEAARALEEAGRDWLGASLPRERPPDPDPPVAPAEPVRRLTTGGTWRDPRRWVEKAFPEGAEARERLLRTLAVPRRTWRAQALADLLILEEAEAELERRIEEGAAELESDLAELVRDQGLVHQHVEDLSGSLTRFDRAIQLRERLAERGGPAEQANLAEELSNKAIVLQETWDHDGVAELLDRARSILEEQVARGEHHLRGTLARICMNRGVALASTGRLEEALELYAQSVDVRQEILREDPDGGHETNLARSLSNQVTVLLSLGRPAEAVELCDRAIRLWQEVFRQDGGTAATIELAQVRMHRSYALSAQRDGPGAVAELDRAIETLEPLVEREGRGELRYYLAMALGSKGTLLDSMEQVEEALACFDRTVEIFDRWVHREGMLERRGELASALLCRAGLRIRSGEEEAGREEAREAIRILAEEVERTGRADLKAQLEQARGQLGEAL